jgi:photosystem II stability/assembly factor-like uncharacterized protein
MKKQSIVTVGAIFIVLTVLLVTNPSISKPVSATPVNQIISPSVIAIDPVSAPNDLDTSVTITGTDFTTDLSGTPPTVLLGSVTLTHVTWVDGTTITATVAWGLDPGVYSLTVTNPDGGSGGLANAFTVTQGIGQWKGSDLFGGEVRQILLKPGDPNTLYALAYAVGIFRSRDAGEHWKFINGNVIGNAGFVIDPLHPAWLYSYATDGLYRSQDEGDTWIKIFNTWPDGRFIARGQVYPSPHNDQVLFISSSVDPYTSSGALGLIKSTDGGASWNIVADMEGVSVQDVDFHPTDPLQMVLGTQSGQVFQSTDGGDTWSEVLKPPISNVGTITYNPYRPAEVWITFDGDGGIYKSTDAAFTSWQNVTLTDGSRNARLVKFTSADSVYTIRHHSEDGGLNWQLFGPVTSSGEMSFDPNNSQIGYIGDDTYGVQKTSDGGQTWEIKSQGLAGLSAYIIEASRTDPLRVFATFEHWPGIYRSEDGASNWTYLPIDGSGNVRVVREDPFEPQRIYVTADSGFYVSINGGASWSDLGWSTPPSWEGGMPNVMEPDPYQPGHLLVSFRTSAKSQLYESNNYGVTWQPIAVTQQDLACIQSLVFHPETPGLVYLSTSGTGLYRSTDSGSTWDRIDDLQQPDMQNEGKIAIATHPQPLLIVWGRQYSYVSMDGGATWKSTPLLTGALFAYLFLDDDSTRLYAATWFGLFFSSNAGESWERAAGVLGKVHVTAMDYSVGTNYTILYAATSGGDPGGTSSSMVVNKPQEVLTAESNLVEAGIYRYVQRTWQMFLPLVGRGN